MTPPFYNHGSKCRPPLLFNPPLLPYNLELESALPTGFENCIYLVIQKYNENALDSL